MQFIPTWIAEVATSIIHHPTTSMLDSLTASQEKTATAIDRTTDLKSQKISDNLYM